MGVSKNRGTPKWMVKIMENPMKIDDLGGFPPIFGNTLYITGQFLIPTFTANFHDGQQGLVTKLDKLDCLPRVSHSVDVYEKHWQGCISANMFKQGST